MTGGGGGTARAITPAGSQGRGQLVQLGKLGTVGPTRVQSLHRFLYRYTGHLDDLLTVGGIGRGANECRFAVADDPVGFRVW